MILKIIIVGIILNWMALGGLILSSMIHEENEKKDIVDYDY